MARLIFWIFLTCGLFSGYWFAATRFLDQALANGIAAAQADGWQIDYAALETTGFPGDFDINAQDMVIVAADGQWAWQGPALQVQAPSIRPTRVTVDLPPTHTLRLGEQTLQIESEALTLGGATALNAAFSFDAETVNATEALIKSNFGWQARREQLDGSTTKQAEADKTYDVDLTTSGVTLPATLLAQIAPVGTLSNMINSVALDSEVTLTQPINRFAFDGSGPEPALEKLVLSHFNMTWGDIAVTAAGVLDVDPEGIPDGRITIQTAQWQAIIDILVVAGAIDAGVAPTLANAARTMVDGNGVLFLPITFRDGFMSMGLLPLGPAPHLR